MKSKESIKDREFAVILEKIHSDFKVFAENLFSVKKRLDLLFEEFGKQKEEIFLIKADIRIIKTDIATLKGDVTILKTDVAEIKEDLKSFDKRLTHLEAVK